MSSHVCDKCKKYPAVIFITKIEGGQTSDEGFCLKCAQELNIKQVGDIIRKLGLTDDDLEDLAEEMMATMDDFDGSSEPTYNDDNTSEDKTTQFPFLNRLFGGPDNSSTHDMMRQGRESKVREQNIKPDESKLEECVDIDSTNRDYSMVIATFPKKETAKRVAKLLVEKRLAACAQIEPIESVYRWKGEIYEELETKLIIKSRTALFDEVAAIIKENHPFEVPEIVQIPIINGIPEYLKWIYACTQTAEGIWSNVIHLLRKDFTEVAIETWFKDCNAVKYDGECLFVHTPILYNKEVIEERFIGAIRAALCELTSSKDVIILDDDGLAAMNNDTNDNYLP